MDTRHDLIDHLVENASMIQTEDLPEAIEALLLLSDLLPPWSPKDRYSVPLRKILHLAMRTPDDDEVQERAIPRPLYF